MYIGSCHELSIVIVYYEICVLFAHLGRVSEKNQLPQNTAGHYDT